ncbi:MAG: HAD-IA family hydrolase [Pseudomonadales bacterium]
MNLDLGEKVKVVTFDLDDTLWDMKPVLVNAEQRVQHWLEEFCPEVTARYTVESLREFKWQIILQNPQLQHQISELRKVAMTEVLLSCDYPRAQARKLAEESFEIFIEARHQVAFFEGALDMLEELSEQYVLGAVTNGNANVYRLGLGDYFSFTVSAEDVNASKPSLEPFMAAQHKAGVGFTEMVHIGDHPQKDVAAAKAAGCKAIWVNFHDTQWTLDESPDGEVSHLAQLPPLIAGLNSDWR